MIRAIAAAKADARSSALRARAALSAEERSARSASVRAALTSLPELQEARAVLAYASFGSEVQLDPWLEALLTRGTGVLLPYVEGGTLGVARVRDLDADLAPGYRGIREPVRSGRRPARADRVDAAVVPGVAFDAAGRRLGYGGGFYDRLLEHLPTATPVIGVAFRAQLIEDVPVEPHDVTVDILVVDDAVYRCRAAG